MTRYAVKVGYRGSDFYGSQIQPGLRTVEGDILRALVETGEGRPPEWFDLKMAGRTDAGVSALGNVAVFNTAFSDPETMLRALNGSTGAIFVLAAAEVDEDFRPRHALTRTYRYLIPSFRTDAEKVRECARMFEGTHDFKRFYKTEGDGKGTVVDIQSIRVEEEGEVIALTFTADHFLWNMIRRISAAFIKVGRGRVDIGTVRRALEGEDITFGLAPPEPLTLTDISYPGLEFTEYRSGVLDRKVRGMLFDNAVREDFLRSI